MRLLIIGVAGGAGRLLAQRLLDDPAVTALTGLDERPLRPAIPGLRFVRAALDQPEVSGLVAGMDAIVHPASLDGGADGSLRVPDRVLVDRTKRLVEMAQAAHVRRLVVILSGAVYGGPPGAVHSEADRIRGHGAGSLVRAQAQIADYLDAVAARWPSGALVQLRAAWLCGPGAMRLVRWWQRVPVIACGRGARLFQALHPDDLAAAVRLALRDGLAGVYNVGGAEPLSLHTVAHMAGRAGACAPLGLLVLRAWLVRHRGGSAPSPDALRALYSGGVLDTSRLREAGWAPRYTTRGALLDALAAL